MSFVAELKQRKVIRVSAAYLVVAWIAIQAASIALPAFDAPAWTLRVVILLFALGFPLAVLLTWALDLTPEGVRLTRGKVGNTRIAAIAAVLVLLALGWYFLGQPALRQQAMASERSIAVLPFANMSGDKANEYFSDGLAETMLDMLAQVDDLKVIARTSSFAFKGKNSDVREIGKALDAAHLLEGSVQQAGDTVRITVQLIRTSDGVHLWSQRYDRKLTDVFSIQDEIATEVVKAMRIRLPRAERTRLTRQRADNVAAYQEYLKGNALIQNRKIPDLRRALLHFERAIAHDPGYARAYVALAHTYQTLDKYATITPQERQRKAVYLQRALELAPELGEAHVTQGDELLFTSHDLAGAERAYRRAIQLAPGFPGGYRRLGELLASDWRFEEGLPLLDKALALDPLSQVNHNRRLYNLSLAGRYDEALAISNRLIAESPDVPEHYMARAAIYGDYGHTIAALRDLQTIQRLDPTAYGSQDDRCNLLVNLGVMEAASACVAGLARRAPGSNTALEAQANLQRAHGEFKAALTTIGRMQPPNQSRRARLLVLSGDGAGALAIYRLIEPKFFAAEAPRIHAGNLHSALWAGVALMQTGLTAQGRSLLNAVIEAHDHIDARMFPMGRNWPDVIAHAQLGDRERAFAALQAGVDRGFFIGLPFLDSNPLVAGLRADPRYNRILAPARARAAAQVEAIRKAGLL